MKKINNLIKNLIRLFLKKIVPETNILFTPEINVLTDPDIYFDSLRLVSNKSDVSKSAKLYPPFNITNSIIGDFTYIAENSIIKYTSIGKFCSFGPNLVCGWGIHPTNGISTAPMFYSTIKQNGITFSKSDKIEETKTIKIGNDVFIGANVTIIDGVTIGDGAVIGAGAVVSKDIPPYAIAVGCPIKVIKYRFESQQIDELLKICWWEFEINELKQVEEMFFDVNSFIKKYAK